MFEKFYDAAAVAAALTPRDAYLPFPKCGEPNTLTEEQKAGMIAAGEKYLDYSEEERKAALIDYALEKNVTALREDLEKYRIFYDVWFRESTLHNNGEVLSAIQKLTDNGFTYEEDGALWLNC